MHFVEEKQMNQQASFWSRLGQWMRFHRDDSVPQLARHDHQLIAPVSNGLKPAGRRRDELIEQMNDGYGRVVHLVSSIETHMKSQDQRGNQAVELLGDMAREMGDLTRTARQHADVLVGLAAQIETSYAKAQDVAAVLADWPRAAMAQEQALSAIAQQVQSSGGAIGKLTHEVCGLGQAVTALGETAREQLHILQHAQEEACQQQARVVAMFEEQTKRFNLLSALTFTLAVIATVSAGISLYF